MTGPTPAVVAAVVEAGSRHGYDPHAGKCACGVDLLSELHPDDHAVRDIAAAAENAALRAAADAWSDWDALEAPEKWLTDRAARVGGEST